MEEDSIPNRKQPAENSSDDRPKWKKADTSIGKTAVKEVPEGPKRPCPNCGSTKLRILTRDEEVAEFYDAFKVRQPMFTLTPPRQCKSCGHRWEVTPSKFILLLALFILAVGFVLGVIGAIGLSVMVITSLGDAESGYSANEHIKAAGFVVLSAAFAAGCVFGFRYYLAKLRKHASREK
jgi:hypothetical protein